MKKTILFGMAAMILAAANVWAQDAAAPAAMDPAMAAKMEKAKKLGAPGENHKVLDALVGKWDQSVKMWMDPSAAPSESKGTSETKWILDGRFIQQEFKGEWAGQPFTGLAIMGYDNVKGEYQSVWMDNMTTGMAKSSAQYDAASKTLTENGTFSCPMTEEKDMKFRAVWKITDNDHHVFEMYTKDQKTGSEYKSMEIAYTRAA